MKLDKRSTLKRAPISELGHFMEQLTALQYQAYGIQLPKSTTHCILFQVVYVAISHTGYLTFALLQHGMKLDALLNY